MAKYNDKGRGDKYGKYDKGVCLTPDEIAGSKLNACQSVADSANEIRNNK